MILSYFNLIFAFALSHHLQNCDYSRPNKAIFKFVWNFQETCKMFFFIKIFSRGKLIFPIPWRLEFKFEVKLEKSKSKSCGILKIENVIKKYFGKHVTKKLLLKKCHVRFILHLALASDGYIWEKAIILLQEWFCSLSF